MGAEEQGNPFLPPDGPEKSTTPETEERGGGGGWGGNQKLQGKIAPPAICPLCAPPARVWFQLARAYGQLPAFYYRRRGVYTGLGKFGFPAAAWALPCPVPFSSLACFRCSPY